MKKVIISTLSAIALLSSTLTANAQVSSENTVQTSHAINTINSADSVATLPQTTGVYQVGTTTFDWLDTSREELLTPDPKDYRELMVQAWYPIDSGIGKETAPYIPLTSEGIEKMAASVGLGKAFAEVNKINTQVFENGELSNQKTKYPVVLFSHGLGQGNWNYQWLTRELASHGYVVFSVEHTGFSSGTEFTNGQFVPITPKFLTGIPTLKEFDDAVDQIWVKDLQFVIRQVETLNQTDIKFNFKDRLDVNRMAAIGHSMGGAAAARALQVEPKIKSAIDIDGSLMGLTGETAKMTKPFAVISNEFNSKVFKGEVEQPLPPGLDEKIVQDMKDSFKVFSNRYTQAIAGPAYDITIAGGATHVSFTDMPLLKQYLIETPYFNILPTGIEPQHIYDLSNRVILSFLEKTLDGKNNTILDRKDFITPDLTIVQ
ncbi:alpha/beta hydrolase family protein [Ammoniphilus resinae]|uniref:Dienelactone hydrolase n=1 Tax=Ammoniphilus resinae TaxID=861532 RepID=A0ABS4GW86_9BACL|nr:alpha/beta fold hydrolase [Ammoniphilus resinae]MBP1934529.1 dienelactone hydrolase [Ammoniphilus resinae]